MTAREEGCGGCTSCCTVPAVFQFRKDFHKLVNSVLPNWKVISKRRAKKLNPYLIKSSKALRLSPTYFSCKHLTEVGCSIHERSPHVCSGYPLYNEPLTKVEQYLENQGTDYTSHCNLIEHVMLTIS